MYRYLRLSLTPHCNLRCAYCLPDGYRAETGQTYLTEDQMLTVVRMLVEDHGVHKIRLTGGEPLLYRPIVGFAERVAQLPGVTDVAVTTNGLRLAALARDLVRSGVGRANVSLDTLDKETFRHLTGADGLRRVLAGIDAALDAGMSPVKVNVVTIRGINDSPKAIRAFLDYAMERPVELRFLELMPIGGRHLLGPEAFVSGAELKATFEDHLGPLEYQGRSGGGTSAQHLLEYQGKSLSIGFINPVSEPFCVSCGRLRLTSEGHLVRCLRTQEHLSLLPWFSPLSPAHASEGPMDRAGDGCDRTALASILSDYLGPKRVAPGFRGTLPMIRIGG